MKAWKFSICFGIMIWCAIVIGGYDAYWNATHTYDGHTMPRHRFMGEIDIQGHMEYAPHQSCAGVYDAPKGDLRFCL